MGPAEQSLAGFDQRTFELATVLGTVPNESCFLDLLLDCASSSGIDLHASPQFLGLVEEALEAQLPRM